LGQQIGARTSSQKLLIPCAGADAALGGGRGARTPTLGWEAAAARGAELPRTGPGLHEEPRSSLAETPSPGLRNHCQQTESNWKEKKRLKESLCLKYALFSFKKSRIPSSSKEEASTETSSLFFALVQEEHIFYTLL